METFTGLTKRGLHIPTQRFNGKDYYLYAGQKYYSRGSKKLHIAVWEYYNGKVPKGFHVHHIDEDSTHNDIDNLELLSAHDHLSFHIQEKLQDAGFRANLLARMAYAAEFAKDWHRSPEGRKWHSEHAKQQVWEDHEYVCVQCGKPFVSRKPSGAKFCCNACKSKWRRENGLDNETRVCAVCGKEFVVSKFRDTITCGRRCAGKHQSATKALRKNL